jgi:hypothetical protein
LQHDLGSCELIPQTKATVVVQASEIATVLQKPSSSSPELGGGKLFTIVLQAEGGRPFVPHYAVSMVHKAATSAERVSSKTWPALNHQHLSLNGFHLVWLGEAPSVDSVVELNADIGLFRSTREYSLVMYANCSDKELCVADGDTVETVLTVQGDSNDSSGASISSKVLAVGSCQWSKAWAEPSFSRLPSLARLRFRIQITDVDDLPVLENVPSVHLVIDAPDGETYGDSVTAASIGNSSVELIAYTPDEVMRQTGPHVMRIYLRQGWDHKRGARADCMLLEHRIEVEPEAVQSSSVAAAIVGGIAAGISFALLAVCCFFGYKWAHIKCLQTVLPGIGFSSRTVLFRR